MTTIGEAIRRDIPRGVELDFVLGLVDGSVYSGEELREMYDLDDGLQFVMGDGSAMLVRDDEIVFAHWKPRKDMFSGLEIIKAGDAENLTNEPPKNYVFPDRPVAPVKSASFGPCSDPAEDQVGVKGNDPFEVFPDIEDDHNVIHEDGSIEKKTLSQHEASALAEGKVWECTVGFARPGDLPRGADAPMRKAIEMAFHELTGYYPRFVYSGWGAELTAGQREAEGLPVEEGPWRVRSVSREDEDCFWEVVFDYIDPDDGRRSHFSRMSVFADGDEAAASSTGEMIARALNHAHVG